MRTKPNHQIDRVTIRYPDGDEAIVSAVHVSHLMQLQDLMEELGERWFTNYCSTGDTLSEEGTWELMGKIAAMLPRHDKPGEYGFDLDKIGCDYQQLHYLFFSEEPDIETFLDKDKGLIDPNKFKQSRLWNLHCYRAKKKQVELAMRSQELLKRLNAERSE